MARLSGCDRVSAEHTRLSYYNSYRWLRSNGLASGLAGVLLSMHTNNSDSMQAEALKSLGLRFVGLRLSLMLMRPW